VSARTPTSPDYAAAREAARRARRGAPIYPGRHFILNGEWVRQDYEGGPLTVVSQLEADAAMLIDIERVA